MKFTLNALPAASFLLFGLVMIYGSVTMDPSFSGSNQHRWVPLGMSIFVSLLAAWLLIREQFVAPDEGVEDLTPISFCLLVLPCILLLAAYAQTQIWVGYPLATFLSGVLIFRLFRNGWLFSILQSVIATLVLYLLFFRVLKLYNPPGRWLELQMPF